METDWMSHPLLPNLCHAAMSATDMEVVQLNDHRSATCHKSLCCDNIGHYWPPYWCRAIRLMCFKIWKTAPQETVTVVWVQSCVRVSTSAFKRKNLAVWWGVWGGWNTFSYSWACYLFHFFAFPLAKLQENICHGFKRFISFKAEGAGRPTHQWDHAILPALTRMG